MLFSAVFVGKKQPTKQTTKTKTQAQLIYLDQGVSSYFCITNFDMRMVLGEGLRVGSRAAVSGPFRDTGYSA